MRFFIVAILQSFFVLGFGLNTFCAEKIFFSSDRGAAPGTDNFHLWMIDPDGDLNSLIQLTTGDVADFKPQLSPDGTKLVFHRSLLPGTACNSIWVLDLATLVAEPVTFNDDSNNDFISVSPTWSPDGQKIAFARIPVSDFGINCNSTGLSKIWTVDYLPSIGAPQELAPGVGAEKISPSWSNDGTNILFGSRVSGNLNPFAIYKLDIATNTEMEIIPWDKGESDPRYSNLSTEFAWTTFRDTPLGLTPGDIYKADVTDPSNTMVRITPTSGFSQASFSPDDTKIVVSEDGEWDIWIFNADGSGAVQEITSGPDIDFDPWWGDTANSSSDRLIKLEKIGDTVIEPGNNYSENTTIKASVIFPPDHPNAGLVDTNFNGIISFAEESSTNYYNGSNGASNLPQGILTTNGVVDITVKSLSDFDPLPSDPSELPNNENDPYLTPVKIIATSPSISPTVGQDPNTNPIEIRQWVDEDQNKFIDWLEEYSNNLYDCYKRTRDIEIKRVTQKVGIISYIPPDLIFREDNNIRCGVTPLDAEDPTLPISPTNRPIYSKKSNIFISPLCSNNDTDNLQRLNLANKLSETVIHESRHAWQNAEPLLKRGSIINNDNNRNTPQNDDDGDGFMEFVSYPGEVLEDENDNSFDDGAFGSDGVRESEATIFGIAKKDLCPES